MESVLSSARTSELSLSGDGLLCKFNELIAEGGRVRLRKNVKAGQMGCDATLVRATRECLTLELETIEARRCGIKPTVSLCVVFKMLQARSTFTARCLNAEFGESLTTIQIETPDDVAKAERRRSPRSGLREPVRVVMWVGGATDPLAEPASLLNLSADGLACRLSNGAGDIALDDVVRVAFQLDHPGSGFDFTARVINLTCGATIDKTIIGLEFVAAEMSPADRDRLVAGIGATSPQ